MSRVIQATNAQLAASANATAVTISACINSRRGNACITRDSSIVVLDRTILSVMPEFVPLTDPDVSCQLTRCFLLSTIDHQEKENGESADTREPVESVGILIHSAG